MRHDLTPFPFRRTIRERLCLLFADLAVRLAGTQPRDPLAYRRGYEVVLVPHPCFRVLLTIPAARRLAEKLLTITGGPDAGGDDRTTPPPAPLRPLSRLNPSVN